MAHASRYTDGAAIAGVAVLALAFGVRDATIGTQLYSMHSDETFQYLEQAWRLNSGNGVVPWEYIDGVRSWLVPGVIAALMWITDWFTDDPLVRVRCVHLAAALLSLSPVYVGFRFGQRIGGTGGAILTGVLCAIWFELIYFAPAILIEVISAHIALWAIYLNATAESTAAARRLLFAGACFALAACLRFQYAPALLGAALWLNRADRARWGWLLAGGLPVALLVGGVLDWATWGLPFQSIWLYVERNALQGVSTANGVERWFYYPREAWWLWHAAAPLALFALAGAVRAPVLALTALLVLAVHSATGHKEYRFIYLALAIAPILMGIGMTMFAGWIARLSRGVLRPFHTGGVLLAGAAVLSWYAATHDLMARRWLRNREVLQPELLAHARPELCGLGIVGTGMFDNGGYVYLGRDVKLFLSSYRPVHHLPGSTVAFRTLVIWHDRPLPQYPGAAMAANTRRFNYLIAPVAEAFPGYDPVACFSGPPGTALEPTVTACLYRRPGDCD